MSKAQLTPLSEVMQALVKLCLDSRTGTMYILTEQEHGALIVLSQEKIVENFYRIAHGMQVVPFMREITTSRYFFKNNPPVANEISPNRGTSQN